jgi:TfoX/Sxy family transcriptional regulator of competence genes
MAKYKKLGLYPFTYTGNKNKVYEMSYMNVPIETLEDREKIKERIYESYEISKKSKKKK